MKTALIVGASGLVGGHLLRKLLNNDRYDIVKALVRKELNLKHEKFVQEVVNFDKLAEYNLVADDVFCCLGTTIAKAGSQDAFRKVDYEYPLNLAKVALNQGAKQFLLVSALDANKNSAIFYSRVKGELEEAISHLGFRSVISFRPSFLLGDRQEFRLGEKIGIGFAKLLSPLMVGGLRKYKGIQASDVAEAMILHAHHDKAGVLFVENTEMLG